MKYLKLLALPILGIFMTGCINMENNSTVKTNGNFESTIRVDMSEFMKLMTAQDPMKDTESDKKSDVCADIKKNYPNSYDCKEVAKYVHEFKNKGTLVTNDKTKNITTILNKDILLVDDQKSANNPKAKNGKTGANPQKFTQVIKFSGEIISSEIGTIDGNKLTILEGIGAEESFNVIFSKNKFDEKNYQYKEMNTSKNKESQTKSRPTIDKAISEQKKLDTKIVAPETKAVETPTPKTVKKTLTEVQKNNVRKALKNSARPALKKPTFKKIVRKNSYQPELIIGRISQRATELQKNRTPEILQNFFQKAAFKK